MSRIALARLITAGNRSSRFRLAGIVAGVSVGVALFLLLFGASQGFAERSLRSTWTQLISVNPVPLTADNQRLEKDEVAASTSVDHYRDQVITVVSIAATTDSTVQVPGSAILPGPGEYIASPALMALIDSVPQDELGDRYGTSVGTISSDALEGPDALVLVTGTTVPHLLASIGQSDAFIVTEFTGFDYSSQTYRVVAVIGAVAVLIPVLLLIAIVTDLGATQRAERFAAIRLIGATPRQLAGIAAAETAITTLLGALIGIGLYLLVVPLAAQLEVGSSTFYPDDLLVSVPVVAIIAAATVAGSSAVAWWRTLRADIGPLGASRERMEQKPHIWSLLPLLTGTSLLGFAVWSSSTGATSTVVGLVVVGGFILTTIGLLTAGPLLTAWTARTAANMAGDASQVIGFSRISRHPRAAFRAVAGLVIATFTVTVFAVSITAAAGVPAINNGHDRLPTSTLFATLAGTPTPNELASLDTIEDVEGVTGTAIGYVDDRQRLILTSIGAETLGLAVPAGTDHVAVDPGLLVDAEAAAKAIMIPAPATLTPALVFVTTDGDPATIERARTALANRQTELAGYAITRPDNSATSSLAMENQFAAMAYIGILIAAALSTVSLAVSTLAAVLNRQRVLGLLRLIGMPRRTLRNMIAYETAVPVLTVFFLSIGLGVFTAWSLITTLTSRTIAWPAPSYYLVLGFCALLVIAAVAGTVKAATTATTTASTRYE